MRNTDYHTLRAEWQAALDRKERRGTDADDLAEQAAYDALVDFVEENNLNYSEYDPRGSGEVCGETYDHDLRLIGKRDGWATHECRRCGAEIEEGL